MIRTTLAITSIAVWASFGLIGPIIGYHGSTSRDVSVRVIAEPFKDNDALVYEWSGDVYRSCPIEIRRHIVDANDVITTLRALSFGALPDDQLGSTSYELTVEVPVLIAEGPAVYYASEISKCSWLQRLRPVSVDYPPVHFTVTR